MILSSLIVLACVEVIALGFPRNDNAEYKIPALPSDSRAQYYVLHDDGTFKYGYDTGSGIYESATKMGENINGFFGFTDAAGKKFRLDYTAGGNRGFVPVIKSEGTEFSQTEPLLKSAPISYAPSKSTRNDASYSFDYQNADSARKEVAYSDLNVNGEYSFVADDGITRKVNYIAGSETGFVATGDFLPIAPEVPLSSPVAASVSQPVVPLVKSVSYEYSPIESTARKDASYSFNYNTPDSSRKEEADSNLNVKGEYSFVADDGLTRKINYVAGSGTGFVATGDFLPKAPEVPVSSPVVARVSQPVVPVLKSTSYDYSPIESTARKDASYSFSYNTPESSRKEEADSDLNVKGEYSFVADDGLTRKINYVAGSGTGFVATGDFLPKAPEVPVSSPVVARVSQAVVPVLKSTSYDYSPIESTARKDASYRFSYNTPDSSRKEEADSDLNVKGEYSFIADDGLTRKINYVAGSGTGFVATGDFLPKAPEVPVSSLTVVSVPQPVVPLVKSISYDYSPIESTARKDASYSFSYNTPDSSRKEEADSDLNVKGEYSFIADDGLTRKINYVAGSGTGFVATGDFLPKAPEVPVSSLTVVSVPQPVVPLVKSISYDYSPIESTARKDASYSFSYNTPDSSRKEEADSNLNVKGEYSFVADDGLTRKVNYVAGSGTGFVATGDFLPKAPEVPVLSPAVVNVPQPVVPLVKSVSYDYSPIESTARKDASYSFSYNTPDSSRKEESDSDLNVKGEYSFVADDGLTRKVNYIAGSGTGFVATGNFLPKAPEIPVSSPVVGKISQPVVPLVKSASYDYSPIESTAKKDASYSFSYNTPDSSRKEEADSDLNVKGEYSFVADDGLTRKINYVAGSGTGFVATGDFLPKAPKVPVLSPAVVNVPQPVVPLVKSVSYDYSPIESTARKDASYSFSYNTPGSSRKEEADSDLNVKGEYSFVADDGLTRKVNYVAGSGTGFVATGDFLPKAPEVPLSSPAVVSVPQPVVPLVKSVSYEYSPIESTARKDASYSFNYNTPDSSRKEEADSDLNVKGEYSFVADDGLTRKVNYVAGSGTGFVATGDFLPKAPEVPLSSPAVVSVPQPVVPLVKSVSYEYSPIESTARKDASYSFNYNTPDSSRKEEADSNLNVKGEYSFVADDGLTRKVNYVAGSGTGFVATGDFLPKAPENSVSSPAILSVPQLASPFVKSVSYEHFPPQKKSDSSTFFRSSVSVKDKTAEQEKSKPFTGVIGDVLLKQYNPDNRSKFGYVFTQI